MVNNAEENLNSASATDRHKWRSVGAVLFGLFIVLSVSQANLWAGLRTKTEASGRNISAVTDSVNNGNRGRQAALFVLAFASVVTVARSGKKTNISPLAALCCLFAAYCAGSFFWSHEPGITLRRLVMIGLLTTGPLCLAITCTETQILRYVTWIGSIAVVLAFASELAIGTFQPHVGKYRFAGLYHPNLQGGDCCVALLGTMALTIKDRTVRWLPIAALAAVLILLTKSRGCFAGAALGISVLSLVAPTYIRVQTVCLSIAGLCLLLLLFQHDLENTVFATLLMGRTEMDPTKLTGRSSLWEVCFEYHQLHPLLGYGFDSFWSPRHVFEISRRENWVIPNSHNSFVDLTLSTGIVGLALFSMIFAGALYRATKRFVAKQTPETAFFLAFLAYYLLVNMLGSRLFFPCLQTMLFYTIVLKLALPSPKPAAKTDEPNNEFGFARQRKSTVGADRSLQIPPQSSNLNTL